MNLRRRWKKMTIVFLTSSKSFAPSVIPSSSLIAVIKVERLRVNVIADVLTLPEPVSVWENFVPSQTPATPLPIPYEKDTLNPDGLNPSGTVPPLSLVTQANIVRLATQESSYLIATAESIFSIEHPDAPAMTVTLSWLNMLEGHIWKRIRGGGLAYSAGIRADLRRGQISFTVYRSPNGFAAWDEARKIVAEIASGEVVLLISWLMRLRLMKPRWKVQSRVLFIKLPIAWGRIWRLPRLGM
jgi:Zn-dependent M16 (insulinase) family peptidase